MTWLDGITDSMDMSLSKPLELVTVSIHTVMTSSHLILCSPLLLLSPILPSIRVIYNESTLYMLKKPYTPVGNRAKSTNVILGRNWAEKKNEVR